MKTYFSFAGYEDIHIGLGLVIFYAQLLILINSFSISLINSFSSLADNLSLS